MTWLTFILMVTCCHVGFAEPLRVHPTNPRYFTDDRGDPILLAGSHFWLNLQDGVRPDPPPAFDYSGWLDFLTSHGHNFFRLWTWEQTRWSPEFSDDYYITPHPYQRTGPGVALDGKAKFDLTRFDQAYFTRLRERVVEAGQRGFYVSVMLFNGWSIQQKGQYTVGQPWDGHPFNSNNNVNGINGDANRNGEGEEVHTLQIPAVTETQKDYVRKVIDTVNDLDNVLYEISNESHSASQDWQYEMINFIKSYEAGKPKQHPVGMTAEWPGGDNAELFASPADWVSLNGNIDNPLPADGSKVILADTDHICGICGNLSWVWKSFLRGENPIFMDQYDDSYKLDGGGYDMNNTNDVRLRTSLGYVRIYAERIDLANMLPHRELASTGYCLASPGVRRSEYLVFLPFGGTVTVNLSATSGLFAIEWFDPTNGSRSGGGTTSGGATRSFTAPFSGEAVLYLRKTRGLSRRHRPQP